MKLKNLHPQTMIKLGEKEMIIKTIHQQKLALKPTKGLWKLYQVADDVNFVDMQTCSFIRRQQCSSKFSKKWCFCKSFTLFCCVVSTTWLKLMRSNQEIAFSVSTSNTSTKYKYVSELSSWKELKWKEENWFLLTDERKFLMYYRFAFSFFQSQATICTFSYN